MGIDFTWKRSSFLGVAADVHMGEIWNIPHARILSTDIDNLRLVVEVANEVGALARFRVFSRAIEGT